MCYKYSSKTLQKPLSREEIVTVVPGSGSKFFFDQNWDGTGLHFSDRDWDGTEKGWSRSCLDSKRSLKGFIRVIILKCQNKKMLEREKDPLRILQHPRSVAYKKP